jgi:hypothetical protein
MRRLHHSLSRERNHSATNWSFMNVQEKPPELNGNPCAACVDEQPVLRAERSPAVASPTQSGIETDNAALRLIEAENAGLRRLIVDLIHENQQLRESVRAAKDEHHLLAS